MTRYFADSSYFYALAMPQDGYHQAAVEFARRWQHPIVTTEYVLIEVANSLRLPRTRALFRTLLHSLSAAPDVEIVPSMADWTARGIRLYLDRLDKGWALTDCISFAVMEERSLLEALTSDHHFEQAGFVAMLRR